MIFKAVKIEQEGIPEDLRQLMDRRLNILYPKVAFYRAGDRHLGGIKKEVIWRTVKNGILLGFTAVIVDKNVPHDRVKPRFYVGANIVLILIGQRPIKGFLEKVFCCFRITGKRDSERCGLSCCAKSRSVIQCE